jgi:hypothetical protein
MRLLGKGQLARLVDIILLGPFMIWYASTTKNETNQTKDEKAARALLFAAGIMTILYNAYNLIGNLPLVNIVIPNMDVTSGLLFIIVFLITFFTLPKEI